LPRDPSSPLRFAQDDGMIGRWTLRVER
jgi:hypothetical protein